MMTGPSGLKFEVSGALKLPLSGQHAHTASCSTQTSWHALLHLSTLIPGGVAAFFTLDATTGADFRIPRRAHVVSQGCRKAGHRHYTPF